MSQTLGQQATTGALWSFLRSGGQQIIRFAVTVVMARLLAPEVFGLVAMLEVFLIVAEKFIYAGFGGALIQKKEVSQTDESTLFWYNLTVAIAAYGALFLAAPWIAAFYDQVELKDILRVAALGLIIGGVNVVHGVRFTRRMNFKIPTIADLCGTVAMGVSGITFALMGHGVWSLVWSNLVRRSTSCVILWLVAKWRPTLDFSRSSMKQIAGYGSPILIASLIDGFCSNLHTVFIGKAYAAADLGFFNRGKAVQSIAVQTSTKPLLSVLFPSFSKLQDNRERLGNAYLKTLRLISFVLSPILFAIAASADPLVEIVYGDRWLPSAPYLFWLACFGVWLPLTAAGFSIYKSLGKGLHFLQMSLVRHGLVVGGMAFGLSFGIRGLIIGMGMGQLLVFLWLSWNLKKDLGLEPHQGLQSVIPSLSIALLGLILAMVFPYRGSIALLSIGINSAIILSTYLTAATLLRIQGLQDCLSIVSPFINKIPLARRLCVALNKHLIN
ncbi:lipopolysaccharide biosynthesis protein [Akkermansiaceae bacterium]|nr:lipopolysaccharide biosynthesis protein [Akkermansiaceae bacterium]